MTAPLLATRDAAVDFLTTHRHGEDRKPCSYCASYYGDILDKLYAAGLLRDPSTVADDEALVGRVVYDVMDRNADLADRMPPQEDWDELTDTVEGALRALAAALTEDPS